jgi:hypothetical protein
MSSRCDREWLTLVAVIPDELISELTCSRGEWSNLMWDVSKWDSLVN